MQGATVDATQGWMAQSAGHDTPAPLSFEEAVKRIARQFGVDVVIDERNHTVDFETDDEALIVKLAMALTDLVGDYEV